MERKLTVLPAQTKKAPNKKIIAVKVPGMTIARLLAFLNKDVDALALSNKRIIDLPPDIDPSESFLVFIGDPADGKLFQTRQDQLKFVRLAMVGQVGGVAGPLDAGGKIPPGQLPALAITDTYVVASQAEMLALNVQVGDVAVRTDNNTSWILQAEPASILANWVQLRQPTAPPDTNFANTNLQLTGNRTHQGNNFDLIYAALKSFDIDATGIYFRQLPEKPFVTTTGADAKFNANLGAGANDKCLQVLILKVGAAAGKILIGSDITAFNGIPCGRIYRLNADGTADTPFNTAMGTGSNSYLTRNFVEQPDGKIIVSGNFTTFNGTPSKFLTRLNLDGSVDTAFAANVSVGTGFAGNPYQPTILASGKILVLGSISAHNAVPQGRIMVFNTDGTPDTVRNGTFGAGFTGTVTYWAYEYPNGKLFVCGDMLTYKGTPIGRLAMINPDGSLDTAFNTNIGTGIDNLAVWATVQPDGKIIVVGIFTTFNGVASKYIVRLNADGTHDAAFTANLGTGFDASISFVTLGEGNKPIVTGNFTLLNERAANRMVRLNTDGTPDDNFNTNTIGDGFNASVYTLGLKGTSEIYCAGYFTAFNGTISYRFMRVDVDKTLITSLVWEETSKQVKVEKFDTTAPLPRNFFTRDQYLTGNRVHTGKKLFGVSIKDFLRWDIDAEQYFLRQLPLAFPDFILDATFNTNIGTGFNNIIYTLAAQPDGKILAGGSFTQFKGVTRNRFVRLNADGTLDTTFSTNIGVAANSDVYTIVLQTNGKILVGGAFTSFNGGTVKYFVRLNADGTADTAFNTNLGVGGNLLVQGIAVQPDGKIVIGGNFTTYNGVSINRLCRLNADGTMDTAFNTALGTAVSGLVTSILIQPDLKIVFAGNFISFNGATVVRIGRLNSDGTPDAVFMANVGSGSFGQISAMALQADGKILIAGAFNTYNSTNIKGIMRVNANGTQDDGFMINAGVGFDTGVGNTLNLMADGRFFVGGTFTKYTGVAAPRIARIFPSGIIGDTFTLNIAAGGFDGEVRAIAQLPTGKLIVAGNFANFNGSPVVRFAQLTTVDTLPFLYWNSNSKQVMQSNDIVNSPTFLKPVKFSPQTAPVNSADATGTDGEFRRDAAGNLYLKTATQWLKFTGATF